METYLMILVHLNSELSALSSASIQNNKTSSLHCSGVENFCCYLFFRCPLPSGISLMQLMWYICHVLFTIRHRGILFLKSMNLHSLLKVKHVTSITYHELIIISYLCNYKKYIKTFIHLNVNIYIVKL